MFKNLKIIIVNCTLKIETLFSVFSLKNYIILLLLTHYNYKNTRLVKQDTQGIQFNKNKKLYHHIIYILLHNGIEKSDNSVNY